MLLLINKFYNKSGDVMNYLTSAVDFQNNSIKKKHIPDIINTESILINDILFKVAKDSINIFSSYPELTCIYIDVVDIPIEIDESNLAYMNIKINFNENTPDAINKEKDILKSFDFNSMKEFLSFFYTSVYRKMFASSSFNNITSPVFPLSLNKEFIKTYCIDNKNDSFKFNYILSDIDNHIHSTIKSLNKWNKHKIDKHDLINLGNYISIQKTEILYSNIYSLIQDDNFTKENQIAIYYKNENNKIKLDIDNGLFEDDVRVSTIKKLLTMNDIEGFISDKKKKIAFNNQDKDINKLIEEDPLYLHQNHLKDYIKEDLHIKSIFQERDSLLSIKMKEVKVKKKRV